jgi:hypothetical protein
VPGERAQTTPTAPDVVNVIRDGLVAVLQVPPPELLSVVHRPEHRVAVPMTGDGRGFTVVTVVAWQPVAVSL